MNEMLEYIVDEKERSVTFKISDDVDYRLLTDEYSEDMFGQNAIWMDSNNGSILKSCYFGPENGYVGEFKDLPIVDGRLSLPFTDLNNIVEKDPINEPSMLIPLEYKKGAGLKEFSFRAGPAIAPNMKKAAIEKPMFTVNIRKHNKINPTPTPTPTPIPPTPPTPKEPPVTPPTPNITPTPTPTPYVTPPTKEDPTKVIKRIFKKIKDILSPLGIPGMTKNKLPSTSDQTNIGLYSMLLLVGVCTACTSMKRLKDKSEGE